jgi:hypothetical protein
LTLNSRPLIQTLVAVSMRLNTTARQSAGETMMRGLLGAEQGRESGLRAR